MPFVETRDGVELFVRDWGAGAPVLFVHGGQLGGEMWEYQAPTLVAAGFRAITYDRRGCGRSDQPGHGYDYDTFADDLAAVLETLDLHGVALVGHSNGCGDIARYLSRHGASRITRCVFVAPTTPLLQQTANNPNGVASAVFEGVVAALERDRPAYFAAYAPVFFGTGLPGVSVSPELIRWGVDLALRASPLATIEMTRAFPASDLRPDLRTMNVPTLILHGKHDETAPLELCGRPTAELIAGSRLEIYETGHGLFITERERLNRDLLDFVTG